MALKPTSPLKYRLVASLPPRVTSSPWVWYVQFGFCVGVCGVYGVCACVFISALIAFIEVVLGVRIGLGGRRRVVADEGIWVSCI